MSEDSSKPRVTGDEYLALEAERTEKRDFLNGEVYAMTGAEEVDEDDGTAVPAASQALG